MHEITDLRAGIRQSLSDYAMEWTTYISWVDSLWKEEFFFTSEDLDEL